MSPLRRKIAAQLVMAQQTAAILTTFNECDMSEVMALRKKAQEKFQADHGVKLGFMSFFIKATVEGSQSRPCHQQPDRRRRFYLRIITTTSASRLGRNAAWSCQSCAMRTRRASPISSGTSADFAGRARDGKIKIEDLQGGTFTISNGGVYGSLMGTPILNPPQSGILGMHAIKQRPVAVKGEVVVRPMMYLALSYDHRAVDGKEAVTFLVKVKEAIENPTALLLELVRSQIRILMRGRPSKSAPRARCASSAASNAQATQ